MSLHLRTPAAAVGAVVLAAALAAPLSAQPASAARSAPAATPGGTPPVALPWKHTRTGGIASAPVDDTALGRAVGAACLQGGPVRGTEVVSWTAPRAQRVFAEQVTTVDVNGDIGSAANGLALVAADGSVLTCLTGNTLQTGPVLTVAKGATLRVVQFVQGRQEPDGLDFEWTQTSLLAQAPTVKAPDNDAVTGARTITKLPAQLKVDLRLATAAAGDWTIASAPCLTGVDSRPGLGRTVWYRYTPSTTQTVLTVPSGDVTAVIAEQTSTGLRWLDGGCAAAGPVPGLDVLQAGRTYLVAVGHRYDMLDQVLSDEIAPTTVVLKKAVPTTEKFAVGRSWISGDGDQVSTALTCPPGATVLVHGRVTGTFVGGSAYVDPFSSDESPCTGSNQVLTAWTTASHALPAEISVVAEVRLVNGVTKVIKPASGR